MYNKYKIKVKYIFIQFNILSYTYNFVFTENYLNLFNFQKKLNYKKQNKILTYYYLLGYNIERTKIVYY